MKTRLFAILLVLALVAGFALSAQPSKAQDAEIVVPGYINIDALGCLAHDDGEDSYTFTEANALSWFEHTGDPVTMTRAILPARFTRMVVRSVFVDEENRCWKSAEDVQMNGQEAFHTNVYVTYLGEAQPIPSGTYIFVISVEIRITVTIDGEAPDGGGQDDDDDDNGGGDDDDAGAEDLCNAREINQSSGTVTVPQGCVVSGDIQVGGSILYDNNARTGLVVFAQTGAITVYAPYGASIWPYGTTAQYAHDQLLVSGCVGGSGCATVSIVNR